MQGRIKEQSCQAPEILTKKCVKWKARSGQALVSLLFFILIGITITTSAVFILFTNSVSGEKMQEGIAAYQIAQSGAENAMLQLLRNPNYTGEVLSVNGGTATIQVTSNSGTYTITSVGQIGNYVKKVQIIGTSQNNIIKFQAMKEIYN